jgi:hypothetical protein
MRGWHFGLIVLVLIAYTIGAMYPGLYTTVRGKIGV